MTTESYSMQLYDRFPKSLRDTLKTVPIDVDNLAGLSEVYELQGLKEAERVLKDWLKAEGIDWAGKSL